jgi:hypothetical protein
MNDFAIVETWHWVWTFLGRQHDCRRHPLGIPHMPCWTFERANDEQAPKAEVQT